MSDQKEPPPTEGQKPSFDENRLKIERLEQQRNAALDEPAKWEKLQYEVVKTGYDLDQRGEQAAAHLKTAIDKKQEREQIPEPMRFFQPPSGPPPEPETPEVRQQRDAEEKFHFLGHEADRLEEMNVPEPARSNALAAIEQRYLQWRDEQDAVPDLYADKETMIRVGNMARALHSDVDQIINTHAAPKTVEGWRTGAYRDEHQREPEPDKPQSG